MNLFSDEIINISKIHTINMYDSKTENPSGIRPYRVNLPTYELIFFLSGEGETCFNGEHIHDCENSVRYLPKGITEGEYKVEKVSDGLCIDIYFDTLDSMPDIALGFENMPNLKNLFLKIYNIWQSKKPGYYIECLTTFYEIIKLFRKHNESYISSLQKEKLSSAYEYIVENYRNSNFDYKELCSKSGHSYSYFKELFVSKYGMPPVKYITRLKIEYAKELLITERYSVAEIAEMCGFENVYYFSTVFKKQVGVSPKNYKLILP